jgi:hypothetical protein
MLIVVRGRPIKTMSHRATAETLKRVFLLEEERILNLLQPALHLSHFIHSFLVKLNKLSLAPSLRLLHRVKLDLCIRDLQGVRRRIDSSDARNRFWGMQTEIAWGKQIWPFSESMPGSCQMQSLKNVSQPINPGASVRIYTVTILIFYSPFVSRLARWWFGEEIEVQGATVKI